MTTSKLELQRQAALDSLELASFESTAFDDLTRLAADMLQAPIAAVTIIDGTRHWLRSRVGLTGPWQGPRGVTFAAHAIEHPDEILVVPDTMLDARFAAMPFVTRPPHVRFCAAAPLTLSSGHAIGTLTVMDTVPRTIDHEQVKQLKFLADQVIQTLEQRQRFVQRADKNAV